MTSATMNGAGGETAVRSPVEGWAILEVMGHRKLAGMVTEVEICGARMLRIDVPDVAEGAEPGAVFATQIYPPSAVFCLTPTTEAKAREEAAYSQPKPVKRWAGLPKPEPEEEEDEPEEEDEEEDRRELERRYRDYD